MLGYCIGSSPAYKKSLNFPFFLWKGSRFTVSAIVATNTIGTSSNICEHYWRIILIKIFFFLRRQKCQELLNIFSKISENSYFRDFQKLKKKLLIIKNMLILLNRLDTLVETVENYSRYFQSCLGKLGIYFNLTN